MRWSFALLWGIALAVVSQRVHAQNEHIEQPRGANASESRVIQYRIVDATRSPLQGREPLHLSYGVNGAFNTADAAADINVVVRKADEKNATEKAVPVEVALNKAECEKKQSAAIGDCKIFLITPKQPWPADHEVIVRGRFSSKTDLLSIGEGWQRSFRVHSGFHLRQAKCASRVYGYGSSDKQLSACDRGPVQLLFSTKISKEELKKIQVRPAPENLKIEVDQYYVSIRGDFHRTGQYQVILPASLRDEYNQTLEHSILLPVEFISMPALEAYAYDAVLRADSAPIIVWRTQGIARVRLRAALLNEAELYARRRANEEGKELAWPVHAAAQWSQDIAVENPTQEWSKLSVDLARFTKGQRGAVLLEVRPTQLIQNTQDKTLPKPLEGLYEVTNLGLAAHLSLARSIVRVTNLVTGAPVPRVRVELHNEKKQTLSVRSDEHGVADFGQNVALSKASWVSALDPATSDRAIILVDETDADDYNDFYNEDYRSYDAAPQKISRKGEWLLGSMLTDRDVYAAGEWVHVVGWAALSTPFTANNVRLLAVGQPVEVQLFHGEQLITRQTASLDARGKFSTKLRIPPRSGDTDYEVVAAIAGSERLGFVDIQVLEFRRAEYKFVSESTVDPSSQSDARSADRDNAVPQIKKDPCDQSRNNIGSGNKFSVMASQDEVEPGQSICVWVVGPRQNAHGWLTISHGGLRNVLDFTMRNGVAAIALEPDDSWTGLTTLSASAVAIEDQLPVFNSASVEVTMSDEHRNLRVELVAPTKAKPEKQVTLQIRVKDSAGNPVAGRVALWAVDEAVVKQEYFPLSSSDFVSELAAQREDEPLVVIEEFDRVIAAGADGFIDDGIGWGGGGMGGWSSTSVTNCHFPVRVSQVSRAHEHTTPVFIADAIVPASGFVTIRAKLPDVSGSFHFFAFASATLEGSNAPGRFGSAEAITQMSNP